MLEYIKMVFINNSQKLMFIHIPKTGGQTIKKVLEDKYQNEWSTNCDAIGKSRSEQIISNYIHPLFITLISKILNLCYGNQYSLQPYHSTLSEIKMTRGVNDYFIFTSVRNPYTRFSSCFYYIRRQIAPHLKYFNIFITVLLILFLLFLYLSKNRQDNKGLYFSVSMIILLVFIILYKCKALQIVNAFFLNINDFIVYFIKNDDNLLKYIFKSQTEYLKPNLSEIDYIIHQENFDNEFKVIVEKYQLKVKYSINLNPDKINYINELNNNSLNFIESYYDADFKNFGYQKKTF